MRPEQLPEMIGREEAGVSDRHRLLHPHQHRLDQRTRQHHERDDDIHDADLLVIEASEPFRPQIAPLAVARQQRGQHDRADHHQRAGERADDLADHRILPRADERQVLPAEPPEHRGPQGNGNGHRAAFVGEWLMPPVVASTRSNRFGVTCANSTGCVMIDRADSRCQVCAFRVRSPRRAVAAQRS